MNRSALIVAVFFGLQTCLSQGGPVPGTSMWLMVNNIQGVMQDAGDLVNMFSLEINAITAKETLFISFLDSFSEQSAEYQVAFFNNIASMQTAIHHVIDELEDAANMQFQLDDKVNSMIDTIQAVTSGNTQLLYEILDTVNTIEMIALMQSDQLEMQQLGLDMLIAQIDSQADVIEHGLCHVVNNQHAIQSALNMVRQNGIRIAQGIAVLGDKNNNISTQLEVLSDILISEWIELSENDAKIFSVVEQLDARVAGVQQTLNCQGQAVEINYVQQGGVCLITKDDILDSPCGIEVTESGIYQLSDSLTLDGNVCISGSMVTIDLNGYALMVAGDTITQIVVQQGSNITIKNGAIIGGQGIVVTNSQHVTIENVQFENVANNCVTFTNVYNGTIAQCTITDGLGAGVIVDAASDIITIENSRVYDCQSAGFAVQGNRITLSDVVAQHNGGDGINVTNAADVYVLRASLDGNTGNGILVDSTVTQVQVESARVMGNGAVGCVDNGATQSVWLNNLSIGNAVEDYEGIKAVAQSKATSFWYNVYGN